MKIAICCDYLYTKGGAEKVVLDMAAALGADVYTSTYVRNRTYAGFGAIKVNAPMGFKLPSPFIQGFAIRHFSGLRLKGYDGIISIGNWTKGIVKKNAKKHLFHYEFSPARMLYDLREEVRARQNPAMRPLFDRWVGWARKYDVENTKRIRRIVANSLTVRERIKKIYGREAEVLYPAVDVRKYYNAKSKGYFISVQRVEPAKRVEVQLEAFAKVPEKKLFVVGPAGNKAYYDKLMKMRPANVEFTGAVGGEELLRMYAECEAVIQTAKDEDFGLIPIEANAAGKPCIAVREGGFRETIVDGKTGVLLEPDYADSLAAAVSGFDFSKIRKKDCVANAERFGMERFRKELKALVKRCAENQ